MRSDMVASPSRRLHRTGAPLSDRTRVPPTSPPHLLRPISPQQIRPSSLIPNSVSPAPSSPSPAVPHFLRNPTTTARPQSRPSTIVHNLDPIADPLLRTSPDPSWPSVTLLLRPATATTTTPWPPPSSDQPRTTELCHHSARDPSMPDLPPAIPLSIHGPEPKPIPSASPFFTGGYASIASSLMADQYHLTFYLIVSVTSAAGMPETSLEPHPTSSALTDIIVHLPSRSLLEL